MKKVLCILFAAAVLSMPCVAQDLERLAQNNLGFEVDLTYEDKIQVGDSLIIRFKEGAQFPVERSKLATVTKNLFFVNRNIKVRVTIVTGQMISLKVKNASMSPPRLNLSEAIKSQLKQVTKSAIVTINDVFYGRVLSIDQQSLTYQPLTKDGQEKGNEKWFAFGLIEKITIKNDKTNSNKPEGNNSRQTDPGILVLSKDSITKLKLVLGDTIGIGLKKGVLSSLSKAKIGLLVWDREQFRETVQYQRSLIASKVRRTRLSADRKYQVKGGTIRVVSQRLRDQSKGFFEFEVRVRHNVDGMILLDAHLQAFKNPSKQTGALGHPEPLPPIFANELFRWKKLVTIDDATIEMVLVLKPQSLVTMNSPKAGLAIGRRLNKPKAGDRLRRAYQAVIDNQHPALISMLMTHLLLPDIKPNVKRLALASFQQAGPKATAHLLNILLADADKLEYVVPDKLGKPLKKPVKTSIRKYRNRVLRLLGKYHGRLPFDQVEQLLKLSKAYEGTQEIEDFMQVLRKHVSSLCSTVVDLATRSKPDEELFKLASDILRSLGKPALPPLLNLFRDRGLEKQARDIEQQLNSKKPAILVQEAIDQVVMIQRQRERKAQQLALNAIRKQIKAAKTIKEPLDAIVAWQKLLETHQKLPQNAILVIEILPEILLNYGHSLLKAKQRGKALSQFRRGLELLSKNPGSRYMAKSRRGLSKGAGKILWAALNEELTGVFIRQGPSFGFKPLRLVDTGDVFPRLVEKPSVANWSPIRVGQREGWLHSTVIQQTKSGQGLRVTTNTQPLSSLQRMFSEGRKLDVSNTDLIHKIQADLLNREIDQFIQANDYQKVLAKIESLEQIAPNHPGLSKKWYARMMLYWLYPTLFGSVLLGALVFAFVHLLLNKQKKINSIEQRTLHDGQERSEIERTFE